MGGPWRAASRSPPPGKKELSGRKKKKVPARSCERKRKGELPARGHRTLNSNQQKEGSLAGCSKEGLLNSSRRGRRSRTAPAFPAKKKKETSAPKNPHSWGVDDPGLPLSNNAQKKACLLRTNEKKKTEPWTGKKNFGYADSPESKKKDSIVKKKGCSISESR